MKKKIIFAVFAVLLAVALMCSACSPSGQNGKKILDLYDSISDAVSATQVISVKKGGDEIAKETLSYNFVTGKVSIERKTLNTSDADELYSTETETKDITGDSIAKLTKDLLNDITATRTTLKATVKNANLNQVFGIQPSDVTGDAKIELVANDTHIVSITVSYTSANGNAVEIATIYVY